MTNPVLVRAARAVDNEFATLLALRPPQPDQLRAWFAKLQSAGGGK